MLQIFIRDQIYIESKTISRSICYMELSIHYAEWASVFSIYSQKENFSVAKLELTMARKKILYDFRIDFWSKNINQREKGLLALIL